MALLGDCCTAFKMAKCTKAGLVVMITGSLSNTKSDLKTYGVVLGSYVTQSSIPCQPAQLMAVLRDSNSNKFLYKLLTQTQRAFQMTSTFTRLAWSEFRTKSFE